MRWLVAVLLVFAAGCTSEKTARRVLAEQGFTDVEMTGHEPFMCGRDDGFSTGFTATSPNGKRVSGAVCNGLFKGSTVRFR
jgi:hypothetical protein